MNITKCELQVMQCVWDSEKELTLPEIVAAVNKKNIKDWKPQTVSTFLARLCRKGYLKLRRSGKNFYYTILAEKNFSKAEALNDFIDMWCGGDIRELWILETEVKQKKVSQ